MTPPNFYVKKIIKNYPILFGKLKKVPYLCIVTLKQQGYEKSRNGRGSSTC